ncbi:MAG: hypothetical protein Q4F00_09080 [bacterium]|nr:hypothetical protein [bacterium]
MKKNSAAKRVSDNNANSFHNSAAVYEAVCEAALAVREFEPAEDENGFVCAYPSAALDCCESSWRDDLDRDYRSR